MRRSYRRISSLVTVFVYFASQIVLAPLAEANLWADRRDVLRKSERAEISTQIASLPSLNSVVPLSPPGSHPVFPNWRRKGPFQSTSALATLVNRIPLGSATIQDAEDFKNPTEPPVVLLQDVHLNVEAQRNLAVVLDSLTASAAVKSIGLEGAFSPLEISRFKAFPDQTIVKEAASLFLDRGLMSAPSFAALTGASRTSFLGVDDRTHHSANVAGYVDAQKFLPKMTRALRAWEADLKTQQEKTCSAPLLEFERMRTRHVSGELGLAPYVQALDRFGLPSDIQIQTFLEAVRLEQNMDFEKVERERRVVLEILARRLNADETSSLLSKSIAYRAGRLGFGDYYADLKSVCATKGVDLSRYPDFDRYIHYVLLSDGIKPQNLFASVRTLECEVEGRLIRNADERRLVDLGHQLLLIKKLIGFALTPEEWKEYRSIDEKIVPSLWSIDDRRTLLSFETFYEEADIRSRLMLDNLLQSRSAAGDKAPMGLVCGGFHTPQITQLLRARKIPFVVVSPKVTKLEDKDSSSYLSIFSRDKAPLDRLFGRDRLFVVPPSQHISNPEAGSARRALITLVSCLTLASGLALPEATAVTKGDSTDPIITIQATESENSKVVHFAGSMAPVHSLSRNVHRVEELQDLSLRGYEFVDSPRPRSWKLRDFLDTPLSWLLSVLALGQLDHVPRRARNYETLKNAQSRIHELLDFPVDAAHMLRALENELIWPTLRSLTPAEAASALSHLADREIARILDRPEISPVKAGLIVHALGADRMRSVAPLMPRMMEEISRWGKPLKIAMVTAEVGELGKVGGVADVVAGSAHTLADFGHEVAVFAPMSSLINRDFLVDTGIGFYVPMPSGLWTCRVQKAKLGEATVYFLQDEENFTGNRPPYSDDPERFAFFDKAVLLAMQQPGIGFRPDIVHVHDWPGGLVPLMIRQDRMEKPDSFFDKTRTVYTIHNLRFSGSFNKNSFGATGLPEWMRDNIDGLEFYGKWSFEKGGIRFADIVTTVGKVYAQEIQAADRGEGFHGLLSNLAQFGLLLGIGNQIGRDWHASVNTNIPSRFDADHLEARAVNKSELQRALGLEESDAHPIFSYIGRIDPFQKGLDLLVESLEPGLLSALHIEFRDDIEWFKRTGFGNVEKLVRTPLYLLVKNGGQVVLHGPADPNDKNAETFRLKVNEIAKLIQLRYPHQIHIQADFEPNAAALLAGSDVCLLPSRYEPFGIVGLQAAAMGAVPLVRSTGGFKENFQAFDPKSGKGDAFVFEKFGPDFLWIAMKTALDTYRNNRRVFGELQKRGLNRELGWEEPAKKYLAVYGEAMRLGPLRDEVDPKPGFVSFPSPGTWAFSLWMPVLRRFPVGGALVVAVLGSAFEGALAVLALHFFPGSWKLAAVLAYGVTELVMHAMAGIFVKDETGAWNRRTLIDVIRGPPALKRAFVAANGIAMSSVLAAIPVLTHSSLSLSFTVGILPHAVLSVLAVLSQLRAPRIVRIAHKRFIDAKVSAVDNNDYWRKMGPTFEKNKAGDTSLEPHIRTLRGLLPNADASIFEIGMGAGRAMSLFRKYGFMKVSGIDVSEENVRRATAALPENRNDFIVGDFVTYHPDGHKFDSIFASDVLLFLSPYDQLAALKKIHSMLKPGGIFFSRWDPGADEISIKEKNLNGEILRDWVFGASPEYLESILHGAGFTLLRPIKKETVTLYPNTPYARAQQYLVVFAQKTPSAGQSPLYLREVDPSLYRVEPIKPSQRLYVVPSRKDIGNFFLDWTTRIITYRGKSGQPFGAITDSAAELLAAFRRSYRETAVDHVFLYGNLGINDWTIAYANGRLYAHNKELKPIGTGKMFSSDRVYSVFVQWKDGRKSIEDIELKKFKFNREGGFFEGGEILLSGSRIEEKIDSAFFGQRLIRQGQPVPLSTVAGQFSDVNHLFHLPEFPSTTNPNVKFSFGHPDLVRNPSKSSLAVHGVLTSLSDSGFVRGEDDSDVFRKSGYAAVGVWEYVKNPGDFFADKKEFHAKLLPGIIPLSAVGISKTGVDIITVPGEKRKSGTSLARFQQALAGRYDDLILMAEGSDIIPSPQIRTKKTTALIVVGSNLWRGKLAEVVSRWRPPANTSSLFNFAIRRGWITETTATRLGFLEEFIYYSLLLLPRLLPRFLPMIGVHEPAILAGLCALHQGLGFWIYYVLINLIFGMTHRQIREWDEGLVRSRPSNYFYRLVVFPVLGGALFRSLIFTNLGSWAGLLGAAFLHALWNNVISYFWNRYLTTWLPYLPAAISAGEENASWPSGKLRKWITTNVTKGESYVSHPNFIAAEKQILDNLLPYAPLNAERKAAAIRDELVLLGMKKTLALRVAKDLVSDFLESPEGKDIFRRVRGVRSYDAQVNAARGLSIEQLLKDPRKRRVITAEVGLFLGLLSHRYKGSSATLPVQAYRTIISAPDDGPQTRALVANFILYLEVCYDASFDSVNHQVGFRPVTRAIIPDRSRWARERDRLGLAIARAFQSRYKRPNKFLEAFRRLERDTGYSFAEIVSEFFYLSVTQRTLEIQHWLEGAMINKPCLPIYYTSLPDYKALHEIFTQKGIDPLEQLTSLSTIQAPFRAVLELAATSSFSKKLIEFQAVHEALALERQLDRGGDPRLLPYYGDEPASENEIYLDLGMGFDGFSSLPTLMGKRQKLLIIEPDRIRAQFLRKGIEIFGLAPHVELLEIDWSEIGLKLAEHAGHIGTIHVHNLGELVESLPDDWVDGLLGLLKPGGRIVLSQPQDASETPVFIGSTAQFISNLWSELDRRIALDLMHRLISNAGHDWTARCGFIDPVRGFVRDESGRSGHVSSSLIVFQNNPVSTERQAREPTPSEQYEFESKWLLLYSTLQEIDPLHAPAYAFKFAQVFESFNPVQRGMVVEHLKTSLDKMESEPHKSSSALTRALTPLVSVVWELQHVSGYRPIGLSELRTRLMHEFDKNVATVLTQISAQKEQLFQNATGDPKVPLLEGQSSEFLDTLREGTATESFLGQLEDASKDLFKRAVEYLIQEYEGKRESKIEMILLSYFNGRLKEAIILVSDILVDRTTYGTTHEFSTQAMKLMNVLAGKMKIIKSSGGQGSQFGGTSWFFSIILFLVLSLKALVHGLESPAPPDHVSPVGIDSVATSLEDPSRKGALLRVIDGMPTDLNVSSLSRFSSDLSASRLKAERVVCPLLKGTDQEIMVEVSKILNGISGMPNSQINLEVAVDLVGSSQERQTALEKAITQRFGSRVRLHWPARHGFRMKDLQDQIGPRGAAQRFDVLVSDDFDLTPDFFEGIADADRWRYTLKLLFTRVQDPYLVDFKDNDPSAFKKFKETVLLLIQA